MTTDEQNSTEVDPHLRLLEGSPGRVDRVEYYQNSLGEVKMRLVKSDKFDRETQLIFLTEFAKHGRIITACRVAGVSSGLVKVELERSEAFEQAYAFALECYRDRLDTHVQDLIFNGYEREKYDRDGNLVSREKTFPEKLIIKEKEKHDEGWRSHRKLDVNVTGGVLVAPASPQSEDDWESQYGDVIDGNFTEAEDT